MWGFDLDGCLVNLAEMVLNIIWERKKLRFEYEDLDNWLDNPKFLLNPGENIEIEKEAVSRCNEVRAIQGGIQFIDALRLSGQQHIAMIITLRGEDLMPATHSWIKKYYRSDQYLVHSVSGDKTTKALELGITAYVEDRLDLAIPMAEAGIVVFLIDSPWNRAGRPKHRNLIPTSWELLHHSFFTLDGYLELVKQSQSLSIRDI